MKRLVFLVSLCLAVPCRGEVVTFSFAGTFTDASGSWFATVGDSFSGTFSYDTATPRSSTGIENSSFLYPAITPPIGFEVSIVAATNPTPIILTAFSEPPSEVLRFSTGHPNPPDGPEWITGGSTRVRGHHSIIPVVQAMGVSFNDDSGHILDTIGSLPKTLPPLTELTEAYFNVGAGNNGPSIRGPITQLVHVPEPATLALLLVACALACIFERERRVKRIS